LAGLPELAAGSETWPTAEKVGWKEVGHRSLAGGGESRRTKGVSNFILSERSESKDLKRSGS
jgi:hypothetical protein